MTSRKRLAERGRIMHIQRSHSTLILSVGQRQNFGENSFQKVGNGR